MRTLEHAKAPLDCELTPREHEIITLVSSGLSNKEIARRLNPTEATVKTHLHNIYQKARVPNRTALTARFQAIRQANGHAHEFVDAQLGQPGGIAVDAWKMAAECVRAIEASSGPARRALLRSLQELWIERAIPSRRADQRPHIDIAFLAAGTRTSRLGLMLDASLYKIAHRNLLESVIVLGGAARHIGTHGQAG